MAAMDIPLPSDLLHFRQTADLDGITYGIEIYWNERLVGGGGWILSIWDQDFTEPILASRRMLIGTQILGRFRGPGLPPGELQLVDVTGENQEPGVADLGLRVRLLYIEASDLAALGAA